MMADKSGLREKGTIKKEKKKNDKKEFNEDINDRLSRFGIGIKKDNNG